jgi:hypothetical protein
MQKLCAQSSDSSRYRDARFIATIIECVTELNIAVDTLLSSKNALLQSPKSTDKLLHGIIQYVNNNLTKNI